MIRTAYIDISVNAHATFSDRLEISQNVEIFFFLLRGSPDWATGRNARQFRPNKYRHKRRRPYEYISVFTHVHTHTTDAERGEGKTERTGGIQVVPAREEEGQRERLSPTLGSRWWPLSRR